MAISNRQDEIRVIGVIINLLQVGNLKKAFEVADEYNISEEQIGLICFNVRQGLYSPRKILRKMKNNFG